MSGRGPKERFFDDHVAQFAPGRLSADDLAKLEWFQSKWRLRPAMTIVEPGCGAGRITQWLLEQVGESGRILAFDPSPHMVAALRRHIPASNVAAVAAEAEAAPLADRIADRVLCCCVFPHFHDKPRALARLAASLKPEGLMFVAHLHSREELNAVHADAGEAVRRDRIPDEAEMRRLFRQAGMTVQEIVDGPGRYHLSARLA